MQNERQIQLLKAIREFKIDNMPIQENIAAQKINNFFGLIGNSILAVMKIIVPIVILRLLHQTHLLIALLVGYGLLAGAFCMTFFNERTLNKKLKLEFEKFQIYLKNKGFTERELQDSILSNGGLGLKQR